MRTNKAERKENAQKFYNKLKHGNGKEAAIVVHRTVSSSNPNICRCQFKTVTGSFGDCTPIVIAESLEGITGCFMELLEAVKPVPQKMYFDTYFAAWLKKTYNLRITYNDGYVILLECCG